MSDTTPASSPATPAHAQDWLLIKSLDLEAQGVAHRADGKVVFIEGALPGEWVSANIHRKKANWEAASLVAVHRESSQRVQPGCPHAGLHTGSCGGCKMQHLDAPAQVAVKARVLEDNLWHLAKVRPDVALSPIHGPSWGYRYRARLSVRYVIKKDDVLIGFHERKSRYIADMRSCRVLPPHVSALLLPLRALIKGMQARDLLPQIELACGDDVTALVLRHLAPLSAPDLAQLRAFSHAHGVQWWLQPKGPETVHLLPLGEAVHPLPPGDAVNSLPLGDAAHPLPLGQAVPEASPSGQSPHATLSYSLPEFGITMPFKPTDFTQVNPHINRVLVSRALRLLAVTPTERVIDWFCGLGNFTLPLATQAREVLGIEGSDTLVARAQANASTALAGMPARGDGSPPQAHFAVRNLFEMTPAVLLADGSAQKWLIDPPRDGAFALVKALAALRQAQGFVPTRSPGLGQGASDAAGVDPAAISASATSASASAVAASAISASAGLPPSKKGAQDADETAREEELVKNPPTSKGGARAGEKAAARLADKAQARAGAIGNVEAFVMPPGSTWQPPQRIVYVSCSPSTLARDAAVLVHLAGYVCKSAGVVNMFPHTAHVESMAVFELSGT